MNNDIVYLNCQNDDWIGDSIDKKYDNYSLDDCVIIRTTDIFPMDKIIETPLHAKAYSFGQSQIFEDAIEEIAKQNIDYKPFVEGEYERLKKELEKYNVAFEVLRSTIHFTINGLVSSHMYGNFDNRDYIIIDPLKYHINNPALRSLRVEDTYFNDDLHLSEEAALIIREEKFAEIKDNPEYMNTLINFKIFVYRGNNETLAVQQALATLGYDSFIINNHGYTNGLNDKTGANKMWQYINELREKYNLSFDRHYNSLDNQNDLSLRIKAGMKTDIEHFLYIINNTSTLSNEVKTKILDLIQKEQSRNNHKESFDSGYTENTINNLKTFSKEIVKHLGLEELARLTKEFNQIFINQLLLTKNSKLK